MSPRKAAKKTQADYVREAHERQLAAGYRRLGVRLPPDADANLQALCARWELTPTAVLVRVLHDRVLAEIAEVNRKR